MLIQYGFTQYSCCFLFWKSGLLLKRKSYLSKKFWDERFFVLRADHTLEYYRRKGDPCPRGRFPISSSTGCEVSDLFVKQKKNQLIYCFRVSFTKLNYETAFLQQPDETTHADGLGAVPSQDLDADDTSSVGNLSRNENNDFGMADTRHSNVVVTGSVCQENRNNCVSPKPPKKSGFTKLLASPFISNRRATSNETNSTPISARSVDGESITFSPYQKRLSVLRHRRPNALSRRAVSHTGGEMMPLDVPDLVEVHPGHRASIPPPEITEGDHVTTISSVTPVVSNMRHSIISVYDEDEQEVLRSQYLSTQRDDQRKAKDRVIQGTQVAAAVGATISLTVLTAGAGLLAGLIALGVAGAAGGGGAAVNATWHRHGRDSRYEIVLACRDYETAKQWKATLDAALESDTVHKSTWGLLFTSDGRRARAALLPKAGPRLSTTEGSAGTTGVHFGRNAKWTLIEGGLLSVVGCGFQGLRVYREDHYSDGKHRHCPLSGRNLLVAPPPPPPQVYASVDGKACPPMKSHVVLSTSALDAFLCLMSFGRVESKKLLQEVDYEDDALITESHHRISFEIVESIDEHADVIRVMFRPLFLFPCWTNPRDFVVFRYWRLEPDGSYVVCYESMEHTKCPPRPDFVRGEMHSVFHIAPQKKLCRKRSAAKSSGPSDCLMTATVQVDPKGWVPTAQWSCLSHQTFSDAFGINALLHLVDIRDEIDHDRFVAVATESGGEPWNSSLALSGDSLSPGLPSSEGLVRNASTDTNDDTLHEDYINYDFAYAGNESMVASPEHFCARPKPLTRAMWAEPDANSFRVRGLHYKYDRKKCNAGPSIGRLMVADVVSVDKPLYDGFSIHPNERIQLGLQRERELIAKGLESDMPPFIFVVNICLPGPPFYHGVYYYAIHDMSTINGKNGTPSSKLCNEFFFGPSDEFRDRTFKLIPQIVQGNFIVRKAVGSTPAIMGKKLRQMYVQNDRFFEVILDCGSSPVATGVIRLSLGYAKSLVVDMGFLLEGDENEYLPERIFGCVRMKNMDFGPHLRHVITVPPANESTMPTKL
jgi:Protein ENHANCED DISEASE RESISTANCE 2, C-terminal/START domain